MSVLIMDETTLKFMDPTTLKEIHAKLDALAEQLATREFSDDRKSYVRDVFEFVSEKVNEFIRMKFRWTFIEKIEHVQLFNKIMHAFSKYFLKKMKARGEKFAKEELSEEKYSIRWNVAHSHLYSKLIKVREFISNCTNQLTTDLLMKL